MAKCPLLVISDKKDTECLKEKCEWYEQMPRRKEADKITHGCAINVISKKISLLTKI